jgi:hypothetical protein
MNKDKLIFRATFHNAFLKDIFDKNSSNQVQELEVDSHMANPPLFELLEFFIKGLGYKMEDNIHIEEKADYEDAKEIQLEKDSKYIIKSLSFEYRSDSYSFTRENNNSNLEVKDILDFFEKCLLISGRYIKELKIYREI